MKFLSSLFLVWFFLGSFFLPLVHLAEVSSVQEMGGGNPREISCTEKSKEISPDVIQCRDYILSFHSERFHSLSRDAEEAIVFSKKHLFQIDPLPIHLSGPLPHKGPDPPIRTHYCSLIGIIKSQVYDACL